MGAEIFDVQIMIDEIPVLYATKVSSKKNKDNSTTLTFNGDINTGAKNTGGTISIEGLYFPSNVQAAIDLENKLNADNIKVITCAGTSYTATGDKYRRIITGTNVTITNDEDEWSPSDGISQKIECAVDTLSRKAETL